MKRFTLLFVCLVLTAFSIMGLYSCKDEECEHEWGGWSTSSASTCKVQGTKVRKCLKCSEPQSDFLDIAAHSYDEDNAVWLWSGAESATVTLHCKYGCDSTKQVNATVTGGVTSQPSCTKNGIETYTASASIDGKVFTDVRTKTVPAFGHTEIEDSAVAPTCGSVGYTRGSHCSVCLKVISPQSEITALEHVFDTDNIVWTWNGIDSATATLSCKFDASHKRQIPASISEVTTIAPTCTETGVITYTASITIDGKTYTATAMDEAGALGHRWDDGIVAVKPTAVADGKRHFECTECDAEKDEEILYPIIRADWNTAFTALKNTNNLSISSSIYAFTATEVLLEEIDYYLIDGEKIAILSVSDDGNAQTYIYRYRGEDCVVSLNGDEWLREPYSIGVEYSACFALPEVYIYSIMAAYDSFVYDELTNSYSASEVPVLREDGTVAHVLGEVVIEIGENVRRVSFSAVEENVSMSMNISFDGFGEATVLVPHVHEWGEWETINALTCTQDGLKVRFCGECEDDQYEYSYAEGHAYSVEVTQPTCEDYGYITYTCYNCPYSYIDDYTEPDGHSWGEFEVENRETLRHCQNDCDGVQYILSIDAVYTGILLLTGENARLGDIRVVAELSDGEEVDITDFELPESEVTVDGSNYLTVNYKTLTTLVSVPAIYSNLDGTNPASEFDYTPSNGEVTINGYKGTASTVVIPAQIGRYPVRYIKDRAFEGDLNITSLTVPPSVYKIGSRAFNGCSGLSSVTFSEGLQEIGYTAFAGCPIRELVIPDSVISISGQNGNGAFEGCILLETVVIGDRLTAIESETFRDCSMLENLTLGSGLLSVESKAFSGCSSLSVLNIASGIRNIGESAFANCISLGEVIIPSNVQSIGNNAFIGCTSLSVLTLGEGLRTIGYSAFSGCPIIELEIPDSVTSISGQNGNGAFEDCILLETVVIGDGLTAIESETFRDCTSLESVVIGDSVMSIGEFTFRGCSSLVDVTFGSRLQTIGVRAFYNCSLLASVVFPASLRTIDYEAFVGCSSLVSIELNEGLRTIGWSAFSGCPITELEIPDSVTGISGQNGDGAFEKCIYLKSVTIGNGLSTLERDTFRGCSALESVVIGNSVVTIEESAFRDCSSLTEITFGAKVKTIERYAFAYCTSLQSVEIPEGSTVADNAFEGCTLLDA